MVFGHGRTMKESSLDVKRFECYSLDVKIFESERQRGTR